MLDPNDPDIAGLIATWIAIAEPPQNATEGANLRYNQWGVVHGTVRGGVITETTGKPDEVGLRSSPEYLWSEKRDLDSVNHCTLGEFVINSLTGASMDYCRGRYQPPVSAIVPSLVGMTMDEAENRLQGLGLTPEWRAGPPAPEERLTGTVANQGTVPGSSLQPGASVPLEIYLEPMRLASVPDLMGKHVDEAEKLIQARGLEPILTVGEPAQSEQQQFTVQSQDPPPNSQLDEGSQVTITLYSQYVPPPTVTVPDLSGLTMTQLANTLKEVGLKGRWREGDPAPSTSLEKTVYEQSPIAGSEIPEGGTVTVTMYGDAPVEVVSSNPVTPSNSSNTQPPTPPPSGGSGGTATAGTPLAFLPPVQQIVVPATIQGINLNTGKATTTRADYKDWLMGDNATHRAYMVAYGRGNPFGNFFEENTDDTTFFLTMAIWLEEGDSWGKNQQFAPKGKTGVETITGDEIFLNADNDAVAYHYSRKGVPAKVILTVAKEKLNSFSDSFRQAYADEIFEQLLGGVKVSESPSATPSTLSNIQLEPSVGRIAKIPLKKDYSPTLRKDAKAWKHPTAPVRYTRFIYEKENPRQYLDGKLEVELFWLEKNDALTGDNRLFFEQLTDWANRTPLPGTFSRSGNHPGPYFIHCSDHYISLKLSSNNAFEYMTYAELEVFSEKLFSQLKAHTLGKQDAYTRIQSFRLPERFQELIPSDSTRDFKPRSQQGEFLGVNAIALDDGKHAVAFFRQAGFSYYTGNKNQGGSNSGSGIFGIPSGNVQLAQNDSVSCYLYWIEKGDPYSPDLARCFIGRDTVDTDNRYANIGSTTYTFHSDRVAARMTAYVDHNKGPKRKATLQQLANDLFRQLEGYALHPNQIPTSPRIK
ncbi:MAG: PASTA domain-containing protein [Verrucomicrobiae bacterium]|nr:PASTA domain-containing protein [Verrucomicrobiae bacterium]